MMAEAAGQTTIVIVDDNQSIAELYSDMLTASGGDLYTIMRATSGKEGLTLTRLFRPDCILLDYSLPDMNGLSFLNRLSESFGLRSIPAIMITGYGDEEIAVEAIKRGCSDYFSKGKVTAKFLATAIGEAIRQARSHRQQLETIKELEHRVMYDELTGLYNRRTIMDLFNREYSRLIRFDDTIAVMMLDIDHFKRVNDTYGHLVGDTILRETGGVVRETIRTIDLGGRVGGEEFLIILPATDLAGGKVIAERIRSRLDRLAHYCDDGSTVSATCSIGLTATDKLGPGVQGLLKRADRALYEAKRQGRNRVISWNGAVKGNEFRPHSYLHLDFVVGSFTGQAMPIMRRNADYR